MATNYQQGYAFESLIRECFEEADFFCMRSSGSHTPTDLAAHSNGLHFYMQLKSTQSKEDLIDLVKLFKSDEIERFLSLPIEEYDESRYKKSLRLILVRDIAGIKVYYHNKKDRLWYETKVLQQLGIELKRKKREKKTDAYKVVFGNK